MSAVEANPGEESPIQWYIEDTVTHGLQFKDKRVGKKPEPENMIFLHWELGTMDLYALKSMQERWILNTPMPVLGQKLEQFTNRIDMATSGRLEQSLTRQIETAEYMYETSRLLGLGSVVVMETASEFDQALKMLLGNTARTMRENKRRQRLLEDTMKNPWRIIWSRIGSSVQTLSKHSLKRLIGA